MANKHNTIELNGKRYDARTGKLLTANQTKKTAPAAKSSGKVIDGFVKKATNTPTRTRSQEIAARKVHSKTERSKTLMRSTVKKPAAKPAPKAAPVVLKKPSPRLSVDPKRLSKSQAISKSNLISRFGAPASQPPKPVKSKTAALPVKSEPKKPVAEIIGHQLGNLAMPAVDKFQQAIDSATSHKQAPAKKPTRRQKLSKKLRVSPKVINTAAASLAVILLAGFIAYQNVPNFSMRIAATRSGVNGNFPAYRPAGFDMDGPIKYQPGQIVLSFKSNSDGRSFNVTQNASQLNSQSLLESYVAVGKRAYQTFQSNGKTIYIYDNNATWVDGGIWYQVEGNSALNSDQLLRIASSL